MGGIKMEPGDNILHEMSEQGMGDVKISPMIGLAAIALNMAMKYHDINTVQDGTLYQQYKLEGREFRDLTLNTVFETAMQIEHHLMAANDRVAKMIVDAMLADGEEEEAGDGPQGPA